MNRTPSGSAADARRRGRSGLSAATSWRPSAVGAVEVGQGFSSALGGVGEAAEPAVRRGARCCSRRAGEMGASRASWTRRCCDGDGCGIGAGSAGTAATAVDEREALWTASQQGFPSGSLDGRRVRCTVPVRTSNRRGEHMLANVVRPPASAAALVLAVVMVWCRRFGRRPRARRRAAVNALVPAGAAGARFRCSALGWVAAHLNLVANCGRRDDVGVTRRIRPWVDPHSTGAVEGLTISTESPRPSLAATTWRSSISRPGGAPIDVDMQYVWLGWSTIGSRGAGFAPDTQGSADGLRQVFGSPRSDGVRVTSGSSSYWCRRAPGPISPSRSPLRIPIVTPFVVVAVMRASAADPAVAVAALDAPVRPRRRRSSGDQRVVEIDPEGDAPSWWSP